MEHGAWGRERKEFRTGNTVTFAKASASRGYRIRAVAAHDRRLLLADRTSCRINIIPAKRKGRIIINDPVLPEKDLKKIPSAKNSKMKITPPRTSFFQAKTRAMIKTKAGMLCTRNPRTCLPKGLSPPNESRENINIKRIERIARIRGNQYKILSIISDCY
jgi:hypothetical protein